VELVKPWKRPRHSGFAGTRPAMHRRAMGTRSVSQREILMDEPQSLLPPARRVLPRMNLPLELEQGPRFRLVVTGKDLDQRRLARAIVPGESVHLTGRDTDTDSVKRYLVAEHH
jgi:hypothetical protein